ncbi:MAG: stage II sporulation protein P, partial [Clostridia bacterium]
VNLGKIFLKNDSTKKIDLDWLLKSKMPFNLKGRGPHVLIVHTHGSEAYFPEGRNTYTPDDVDRTIDTRYNVVRIGDEVAKILKGQGIDVVHNRNIYDSPTYNGSYTRTLAAISAQMKKTPQIKVIIDIHRDSMVTKSGTQYKTLAKVNGKDAAQIMLVMSTGESGLPNPNWQENLKFGVKLQCQIANKYPGLMRPINLRKERFNMHVATGSMLIEVGSSANTLQEAINAVTPFSEELARLLKSVRK